MSVYGSINRHLRAYRDAGIPGKERQRLWIPDQVGDDGGRKGGYYEIVPSLGSFALLRTSRTGALFRMGIMAKKSWLFIVGRGAHTSENTRYDGAAQARGVVGTCVSVERNTLLGRWWISGSPDRQDSETCSAKPLAPRQWNTLRVAHFPATTPAARIPPIPHTRPEPE